MATARHSLTALICAVTTLSAAAATARADLPRPLFADDETLSVRIVAPLQTIMKQRDEKTYHEGTFTYTRKDGTSSTLHAKIRARGHFRRQPTICRFAPLLLNFRKGEIEETLFAGQNKLKLVTHCKTSRRSYEQLILKEYLAYRILGTVTNSSFRVRLLRVEWLDSEQPTDTFMRYAFLIEDEDLMAARLGTKVADIDGAKADELVPAQSALVAIFEYLIGNTDFSMLLSAKEGECCHNTILLEQDSGKYLPIPYDFDFSGLVNARYAKPGPKMWIRDVRTRLYRGHCEVNERIPAALQRFREQRDVIESLVADQEGMTEGTRRRTLRYVQRFYAVINRPERVQRRLVKACI